MVAYVPKLGTFILSSWPHFKALVSSQFNKFQVHLLQSYLKKSATIVTMVAYEPNLGTFIVSSWPHFEELVSPQFNKFQVHLLQSYL